MGLKLISPPASDPISIAEAKMHLRVVDADEDTLIAALVKSATQHAEAFTGRAFIDQTWELSIDQFPTGNELEIEIPKPPLIGVGRIAFDNTVGFEQVVSSDDYYVDTASEPGWVVPAGGFIWPTPLDAINAVRIQFRAGYVDPNAPTNPMVPEDIKAAIKLILGSLFEQRESQVVGTTVMRLPWGAEQLLRQHRILLGMA